MHAERVDELKPEDMIEEFGIPDAPMDAELVVSMLDDLKSMIAPSREPRSELPDASQL